MQSISCSEMNDVNVSEMKNSIRPAFCTEDTYISANTSSSENKDRFLSSSGDDSIYSSFPGSPRNRKSKEDNFDSLKSQVPKDYDYSKSTEHSYSINSEKLKRDDIYRSNNYDIRDGDGVEKKESCGGKYSSVEVSLSAVEAEISSIFQPHAEGPVIKIKKEERKDEENGPVCVGKYAEQRRELDYSYHSQYTPERQLFHDILIDRFFDTTVHDEETKMVCDRPRDNWLVFTAGCMGAGKGHTLTWLHSQGIFPLDAFVRVDPDALRELLPETAGYIKRDPSTAGYLTQKEVGCICEVLTISALEQGKNVLVDGSLRDASWYLQYISDLRWRFPKLKIAIIYVTASPQTILRRATKRADATGRMVPEEVILKTMRALPRSIKMLSPIVDFVVTFENEEKPGVPRLLHSIRRNSSVFLASLDAEITSGSPPLSLPLSKSNTISSPLPVSASVLASNSDSDHFLNNGGRSYAESPYIDLEEKMNENFFSSAQSKISKHSALLNTFGDVTYELHRRNSDRGLENRKRSLDRMGTMTKEMGDEINRMMQDVSEIKLNIEGEEEGDGEEYEYINDDDDEGSLFYISYTEGDLNTGDDGGWESEGQRGRAIDVTGERNKDFGNDVIIQDGESDIDEDEDEDEDRVEGAEEKVERIKSRKSMRPSSSSPLHSSVTGGLDGFRAHTGDWKEEFRSVWKMQCALR